MRAVNIFITTVLLISGLTAVPANASEDLTVDPDIPTTSLPDTSLVTQTTLVSDQEPGNPSDGSVQVKAMTDAPVEQTNDSIEIVDYENNAVVATCTTGTECSYDYKTVDYAPDAKFFARTTNTTSNTVQVLNSIPTITLTSTREEAESWDSYDVKLETQGTLPAGKKYFIVNQETNQVVLTCGNDEFFGCFFTEQLDSDESKTYRAYIADANNATQFSGLTGIVASSNTRTISRTPWNIVLTTEDSYIEEGSSFWLYTETNQIVPDGLSVYFYNQSTGKFVEPNQKPDDYCLNDYTKKECITSFAFVKGQTYVAYIAAENNALTANSTLSSLTDIRAISNTVAVKQIPWNIYLTRGGLGGNGEYVYTGHVNQHAINYVSALINSAGKIVTLCKGLLECEYENSLVSPRHTIVSYVVGRWSEGVFDEVIQDEPGGSIYDIQASYSMTGSGSAPGSSLGSPHSTTGGSNPSQPCPQTCVADPINTVTGEFWLNETDLATKSQIPLQLTRSYSVSKRSIQGSLGYGWSTNYDMKISPIGFSTLSSASTLQVAQENGSLITFAKNSAGLWETDLKTKATLQEQNGTYVLTRDKTTIFVFNAIGQLTSVKDLNNNTISLAYTNGKLATVTSNKGQSLSFTWNSNNLISQVQTNGGRAVQYAYNTAKELVTITHADASTQKYTYDTSHALLKQIDERAKTTTNVYDSQKRVIEQTDPSGNKTSISYSALRTEITNPNGRADQHNFNALGQVYWVKKGSYSEYYEYDAAGNLTLKTYPNGSTLQYTYDANGNVLQAKDQSGNITSYTYNALNLPLSETNAANKTKTYAYDNAGNLTSFTDYNGNVTTSVVNPDGTVQKTVLPNTGENSYTYNVNGLVETNTNPLGGVGINTYDADGQMLTRTDAQNNTTTYTYNAVGLVTNVQHPNTYSDVITYDAAGNTLTETNRLGDVTTYTYDNLNRVLTVKDPKAKITKNTYDSMGNIVTSTDQLNNATTFGYDEYGNLVEKTDANYQSETYSYNNMLQLVKKTDNSNGAEWHYSYDPNGRVVQTTNPVGVKTKVEYNNLGLPTKTVDEQKKLTLYTYDNNGNSLTVTRPDLTVETNTYDSLNLNTSHTDSSGGVKEWSYNLAGSPTSFTNTDDLITSYEYNNVGLLVKEVRPDSTNVTYEYQFSKLTKETYSDSVLEYEYNNAGYLSKEKQGTDVISYTYDKNGNIVSRGKTGQLVSYLYTNRNEISRITYASGKQMNYVYDNVGNLISATNAQTGTFNYTYDDSRNVTNIENPNGVQQEFTYNTNRQMTSNTITGSAEFYNKTYTYNDVSGYLDSTSTGVRQPTDEQLNESYSYDVRGRLIGVDADQTNGGSYGYSATGNLTNNLGATQTFNTSNQLTSTPQNSYSFDGRGNRTADVSTGSTVNTTYNQSDKLTSWTKGTTNVQYQYDANGLIKKRTQGSTNQNFIWDYNNAVPLLLDDGKYEYLYGESNTPVAQIEKSNGKVTYLHSDSLGTVTLATKADSNQAALYVYDAYGKLNTIWSTDASRTVTRFGYAGEWADPTTGLYNLRARWYEPTTGTFLSEDPLVQFTNEAYAYGAGNPLAYTDPLGLFSEEWEAGQARQRFFASDGFKSFVNGFTSVVLTGGAIVLGAACIAATAGICGGAIGSALVIGAIGVGSSSLEYVLTESCQSSSGLMAAAVVGGLTGGKGKAVSKAAASAAGRTAVKPGQVGTYNSMKGLKYDDLEAHHMPSSGHLRQELGYTRTEANQKGGAIVMTKSDHKQTRTYGGRNTPILKNEAGLDLNEVLNRDLDDYVKITGNKKAANELREWHKQNSSWYKG